MNMFSCAPEAVSCSMVPDNYLDSQCSNDNETGAHHRIPAFFLLRRGAKLTMLYSHGNAEDLGMMYRRMKDLARILCVNVLAYDYSGYGLSQPKCKPSERMCYRNIEAAYSYLVNVMKIPPSRIVLYGRSLGSGPSCYLAKKTADEGESVAGLILHSPFLSIYRIVLDVRSGFVGDIFQSYARAKSIKCPVFIIHGENDQVVPFWHSDELLRSFQPQYRAQPFFVKGLGHNNIEMKKRAEYIERVVNFLDKYVIDGPGIVPEHERYMPETTLNDAGKFFINHTWIKHGREIVRYAMKPSDPRSHVNRASRQGKPKQRSQSQSHSPPTKSQLKPQSPQESIADTPIELIKTRTNENGLLAKFLINDNGGGEDESTPQFIETMESWATEDTDIKTCSFDSSFDSKVALNVENESGVPDYSLGMNDRLEKLGIRESYLLAQTNLRVLDHDCMTPQQARRGDDTEHERYGSPLENVTNQVGEA